MGKPWSTKIDKLAVGALSPPPKPFIETPQHLLWSGHMANKSSMARFETRACEQHLFTVFM